MTGVEHGPIWLRGAIGAPQPRLQSTIQKGGR